MANLDNSVLKLLLKYRAFTYGRIVHFRRHCLQNVSAFEVLHFQCRRHIMSTSSWRSRQTGDIIDHIVKQKTQEKEKETLQKTKETDSLDDENVPLIVKLMFQNRNRVTQNDEQNQTDQPQKLTIQQLQKTLEDIKWDADATKLRMNVEGLEEEDEVESDDHEPDGELPMMTTIEDIYLDDEVHTRTIGQRSKNNQKIKGTPDPSIHASDVPCSGCGATLHCQDPVIPGYMPSEKFKCLTRDDMRTSMCQRCFLINTYNMYLNVRVSAETYPQIIQKIKHTKALVIVVVDLFDIENSVYKDLLKHIGTSRPLFIVGNKVDLIPRDSRGYLERTRQRLLEMCSSAGLNPTGKNIKHVCLVSAKTGYGIESLVTKLMTAWQLKGHVYVVGSTNAGKSTLFNALLMSDYCKTVARGFINRATVSVWPGTTLNLLQFPIINPAPWRLALRYNRLAKDQKEYAVAEELRRSRLEELGSFKADLLTGHVGLTDFRSARTIAEEKAEAERQTVGQSVVSFSMGKDGVLKEASGNETVNTGAKSTGYRPERFKMYWCNDTPGVVNPEQIINLLEPEELRTLLPRTKVIPQCLVLRPGQVLFVTGMGRIDYVQGNTSVYLTAYVSQAIKLHVKDRAEADHFHHTHLGTASLAIPLGNEERLSRIPSLIGREFHITGTNWDEAAADIQLSSLGWVSVAAGPGMPVTLRAFTPGARGLHLRTPALLPHYTSFRGRRKGKTPFYRPKQLPL
ncbi:nitric oxide-associated protein 1-like [Babylonia areolata]|uniref:nitric oxide-associated protein 1-like n=1 Tax=Babylonia areolata TaxID=304850 RepID=UPI003FCFB57E